MRSTFLALSLAAALAAFAGCAAVPTQNLDAATRAMNDAKLAQAPDYAPDAWRAASDAQARLEAELGVQDQRSALFRSYDKVREIANEVKEAADRAASEASTGKQRAKEEATSLMAQAKEAIDRAQKELAEAPRGKGTEADLASLKSDVRGTATTLQEVQADFNAGDYNGAKVKARSVISEAEKIQKQVEDATAMRRGERHA